MGDNPLGTPQQDDQGTQQNPRGFDVGAQPAGQPAQPQADPSLVPGATVTAANADMQHHYGIGRAFKSLLGGPSTQTDPRTGQEVPVKKDHGVLMRGILAGALLGSAAGSETPNNGYSGFARGGAAAIQDGRNQELMKQKQAQQEFENKLKSQKEDREDTLIKAQTAHYNAQTVRENQLIQGTDHEFHEKQANYGKTQMQPFIDAGLPYEFKDQSESQMNDLIKNNPNAHNMLWEPTGTKVTTDPNGKTGIEMTYSAVDPKGKVKVTDAQIKQWKEDGLDQVYGDKFADIVKNKELDASSYMAISQKGQELGNKQLLKKRQDFEMDKDKAQIDLTKAQTAHVRAEAGKLNADISDKKAFDSGWDALMSGGDIGKLSAKQRAAVTKGITEVQNTIERRIHELPKDESGNPRDQAAAKELQNTWDTYQGIQNKVYGVQKKEQVKTNQAGAVSENTKNVSRIMTEDKGIQAGSEDAYSFVAKSNLSPEEKRQLNIQQGNLVPDDLVTEMASKATLPKKDVEQKLRDQGYKLAKDKEWERKKSEAQDIMNTPANIN